jgi:predicted O-methyltransferase YrrM
MTVREIVAVREHLEDLPHGWFNHGPQVLELLDLYKPKVVVELGSWLGASAIAMARSVRRWGGTVTCVDTWAGELDEDGGSPSGKNPLMILSCARAMIDAGVSASIRLIPATTSDAAQHWKEPIDFLYVDADHSYSGCMTDLLKWVPHVKPGGLIAGDDYHHPRYPGVQMAWDEFEQVQGLTLTRSPALPNGVQLIYGTKGMTASWLRNPRLSR